MEKILLDTDIGTEVDDAITLAYLLAREDVELVGITTVAGEAVARAKLASVLCKVAGKQVPIVAGCEKPILCEQIEKYAPQSTILKDWAHDTDFTPNQAVAFMQKTIRENPGEITLMAIAPLTNVGLLFAIDPEIPSLLKGLVMMCGSPTYTRYDGTSETMSAMQASDQIVLGSKGVLENNALIDPHATKLVYDAKVQKHISFGLNVTSRLMQKPEAAERLFQHPLLRPVLDIAREWFRDEERVTYHDPLAAVAYLHPEICGFAQGNMEIETQSPLLSGFTYWRPAADGAHTIATDVNEALFFKHLFAPFGVEV